MAWMRGRHEPLFPQRLFLRRIATGYPPCPFAHSQPTLAPGATPAAFYRRSNHLGPAAFCGRSGRRQSNSLIDPRSGNLKSLIHCGISLFRTLGNFLENQSNLAVLLALGEGQMCVEVANFPVFSHLTGNIP
jgi:hypothetical protein